MRKSLFRRHKCGFLLFPILLEGARMTAMNLYQGLTVRTRPAPIPSVCNTHVLVMATQEASGQYARDTRQNGLLTPGLAQTLPLLVSAALAELNSCQQ